MSVFVHESAYVDEGAVVGDGSKVWHYTHVQKGAQIGRNCVLGQNVNVGPNVRIGDGCKIQNNVSVYEGVELADEVFCGPSMVFTNVQTPRAFVVRKDNLAKTHVGRGATLGANSTVVCGHNVGQYALVGAGAVVTADVMPYSIVKGVPGRHSGWACRCGVPLRDQLSCGECGRRYRETDGRLYPLDAEG